MKAQALTVRDGRKPGWFHIDNEIIDHYGPDIGAMGVAVYCALARYSDRDGRAFPSHQRLADHLHIAKNTLKSALRRLEEFGLITIAQQTDGAGNPISTNIYTLCPVAQQERKKHHGGVSAVDQGGSIIDTPLSAVDTGGSAVDQGGSTAAYEEDSCNKTHITPPPPAQPAPPGGGGGDSYETDVRQLLGGYNILAAAKIATQYAALTARPSLDAIRAAVVSMAGSDPNTPSRIARRLMDCPPPWPELRAAAKSAPLQATRVPQPENVISPAALAALLKERHVTS